MRAATAGENCRIDEGNPGAAADLEEEDVAAVEAAQTPPGADPDAALIAKTHVAALEVAIADVWGSVLGIEPIGIEDDFFDLGGHSLLAVDLIESMRARLGVNMEARMLYLQPTVAELADQLSPPSLSAATPEAPRS